MIGSLVNPILVDLKINIVVFAESLKLFFKMFISHGFGNKIMKYYQNIKNKKKMGTSARIFKFKKKLNDLVLSVLENNR